MTTRLRRRWSVMPILALALAAVSLPALPTTAAPADVVRLTMDSEPGDWIGQGQSRQYTEADGTFSATSSSGGQRVTVLFNGGSGVWWNLQFKAPDGSALTRGPYEGATRAAFSSPTGSGLDVSGSGRGCNTLTGRFDVREVAIGPDGSVDRLAVQFEQHCEGGDPALLGEILFHADAPYEPPADTDGDDVPDTVDNCDDVANPGQANADRDLLGNACDSAFDNTNLTFDSEPGDYIGQGIQETWYLQDGTFTASGGPSTVTVAFNGGPTNWRLSFDAPDGAVLTPGTYDGATRYPFNEPGTPGLSVSGSGRGCNTLTGSFEVREVDWEPDGALGRFSAAFEQYCGNSSGALRGIVNVNASPAMPVADAGPDLGVEAQGPTTLVTLDGSGSTHPDGEELTYTWSGDLVGGTATGPAPAIRVVGLGATEIALTVSDGQRSDTDTVLVTVVDTTPPQAAASLVPQGNFNRRGGRALVQAACTDLVDEAPSIQAAINGVAVEDGQVVRLVPDDQYGSTVSRKGGLTISGADATLVVTCADASGNASSAKDRLAL